MIQEIQNTSHEADRQTVFEDKNVLTKAGETQVVSMKITARGEQQEK